MSDPRAVLYVEGKDDLNSIIHLLRRHQIDTEASRVFDIKTTRDDDDETESVEKLLGAIYDAVRQSRTRPVGFVLDADSNIQNRWDAVRFRLEKVGINCPQIPVRGGFIAEAPQFRTTVGVWLMPNNTDSGMLEHFLHDLIVEGDKLLPLAQSATTGAMSTDRRFPEIHEPKAVVHTWLAWQEKPGLPYGTAIKAEYFLHNTETAIAFVDWFRKLFGMESPVVP